MVSGSGVGNAIHNFLLCWSFRERRRKRICIKRKRFVEDEPDFPHLIQFRNDLEKNETWVKIDLECKRWGGRGL